MTLRALHTAHDTELFLAHHSGIGGGRSVGCDRRQRATVPTVDTPVALSAPLRVEDEPLPTDVAALGDQLYRYNAAVTGCDDIREAALWSPALTTVAIDTTAMGELAAQMLLDRIADHKAPRRETVLEPKLVVRASSGQPINDRARPTRRSAGK